MAVEVLLMSKVDGLGIEGDVVRVADGYARNYLFPNKLAAEVTEGKKRQIEKKRQARLLEMQKEIEAAKELAKQIEKAICTIAVKTAEGGKLFGSVTAANIAEVLKEQGLELDRHCIGLEEPIKEVGFFTVQINLNPQVKAALKVSVVDENE